MELISVVGWPAGPVCAVVYQPPLGNVTGLEGPGTLEAIYVT